MHVLILQTINLIYYWQDFANHAIQFMFHIMPFEIHHVYRNLTIEAYLPPGLVCWRCSILPFHQVKHL